MRSTLAELCGTVVGRGTDNDDSIAGSGFLKRRSVLDGGSIRRSFGAIIGRVLVSVKHLVLCRRVGVDDDLLDIWPLLRQDPVVFVHHCARINIRKVLLDIIQWGVGKRNIVDPSHIFEHAESRRRFAH